MKVSLIPVHIRWSFPPMSATAFDTNLLREYDHYVTARTDQVSREYGPRLMYQRKAWGRGRCLRAIEAEMEIRSIDNVECTATRADP